MSKTLLLFEQINSFEQYFASHISKNNVTVSTPYKEVNSKLVHHLRAACKRIPISRFHDSWLESWSKSLLDYEVIIVFDNAATPRLLNYLRSYISPSQKVKIWLWNVPNDNLDYFKQHFDVYCFDQSYSEKNNLRFLDQFYILDSVEVENRNTVIDFYFIGADKGRLSILEELAESLERQNLSYQFDVVGLKKQPKFNNINVLNQFLAYDEVIENIESSQVIVEINKENQSGLTLRALEALFYAKKLVTNNSNIKNYDFYDEANIYVLGDDNRENLKEFLGRKYRSVSSEIIKNYGFSVWLSAISRDSKG